LKALYFSLSRNTHRFQIARRQRGAPLLLLLSTCLLVKELAEALNCWSGDPVKGPVTFAGWAQNLPPRSAGMRQSSFLAPFEILCGDDNGAPYRLELNAA
jgi:hypothetical protein